MPSLSHASGAASKQTALLFVPLPASSLYRSCSQSRYIGQAVVSELLLASLQRVLLYVREHEADFIRQATENGDTETRKLLESKRRELDKATARMAEIDTVFRRLYEDNALGRLSEQQFLSLTSGFESEKAALQKKLTELEGEIGSAEKRGIDAGKFVNIVKLYTDIHELTYENVHEFVDKIFVHEPDSETKIQKVEIFYNFVGRIDSGDEPTGGVSYLRGRRKNVNPLYRYVTSALILTTGY